MNRLPPEYRRRYYTNLAFIAGLLVFFFNIGRLGSHNGPLAVIGLFCFLVVFSCVWPLVQILRYKPRPQRAAFVLYGAWIAAYGYVAAALFVGGLPAFVVVWLLGFVLMCAFLIIYRKIVFPNFFGGEFRKRWQTVREAQRADKDELDSVISSIRPRG